MSTKRRIAFKPIFLDQLRALPQRDRELALSKMEILADNPAPDSANKKRLQGTNPPLFRIRAGDYRIMYQFDERWVELLTVVHRSRAYPPDLPEIDQITFEIPDVPSLESGMTIEVPAGLQIAPVVDHGQHPQGPPVRDESDVLPYRLTSDFVSHLGLEQYALELVGIETLGALQAAQIPDRVRERVLNIVCEFSPDEIVRQKSFVVYSLDALTDIDASDWTGFLLRLSDEQEKVVERATRGLMLLKGGPGTGKSVVAAHTAASRLMQMEESGEFRGRILLTTYSRTLATQAQRLVERLVGRERARRIDVRNVDRLVYQVVARNMSNVQIIADRDLQAVYRRAFEGVVQAASDEERDRIRRLSERLGHNYLFEEIETVIVGRGLSTIDEYLQENRAGRGTGHGLVPEDRRRVWRVAEEMNRILEGRKQFTWRSIRAKAWELQRDGKGIRGYGAVIVDEAQDLDRVALRFLLELAPNTDSLFITADVNQKIFAGGVRWADVDEYLNMRGRSSILRKTYRSTRQIADAATAYLTRLSDTEEGLIAIAATEGPKPIVYRASSQEEERQALMAFLREYIRQDLPAEACAVLVPNERVAEVVVRWLTEEGIAAFAARRRMDIAPPGHVRILPYKSAKGTEFQAVAIVGLLGSDLFGLAHFRRDAAIPSWSSSSDLIDDDLMDDDSNPLLALAIRTLYVCMTRSMYQLMLIAPMAPAPWLRPLLTGIDTEYWDDSWRPVIDNGNQP